MTRWILAFLVLPLTAWTSEPPKCEVDLANAKQVAEIMAFLSFDHPILERAVARAANFRSLYFLVHLTGGFLFSTDPERYRLAWRPANRSFAFSAPPTHDNDDQYLNYLATHARPSQWLQSQHAKFVQWTTQWPLQPEHQRYDAALNYISQIAVTLRQLSRAPKQARAYVESFDLQLTTDEQSETRDLFSPDDLGTIRKMYNSLEDDQVFDQVLQQVSRAIPALLRRRLDFRVRLFATHASSPDSSGKEIIANPNRIDKSDLPAFKNWVERDTRVKRELRSYIRDLIGQDRIDSPAMDLPAFTEVSERNGLLQNVRAQLTAMNENRELLTPSQWEERASHLTYLFMELSQSIPLPYPQMVVENLRILGQDLLTKNSRELSEANWIPLSYQLTEWEKLARTANEELFPIVESGEILHRLLSEAYLEISRTAQADPVTRAEINKLRGLTERLQFLQRFLRLVEQSMAGLELRLTIQQQTVANATHLKLILGAVNTARSVGAPTEVQIRSLREGLESLFKSLDLAVPL